jgi:predicted acylesterase/phospholipase RssA
VVDVPKKVAVACQGGGIHAAFAVGVLTEILKEYEKKKFELVGLSGTSAGARPDGVVRPCPEEWRRRLSA